jgi:hypothetical protein
MTYTSVPLEAPSSPPSEGQSCPTPSPLLPHHRSWAPSFTLGCAPDAGESPPPILTLRPILTLETTAAVAASPPRGICPADQPLPTPNIVISNTKASDFLDDCSTVAPSDLNADGVDDVVLGALLADSMDNRRKGAGEVHVFLSRP